MKVQEAIRERERESENETFLPVVSVETELPTVLNRGLRGGISDTRM